MTNMEDTSGFYKLDGDLLFGPNFVLNSNYELRRETHEQHTYPIDGWYWCNSLEEACTILEININDYLNTEQING